MATWTEVQERSGQRALLPEGQRNYEIVACRPQINEFNSRREAYVELRSGTDRGSITVPLEPWDPSPDKVELFENIFLGQAQGLGFTPSKDDLPIQACIDEFAQYVQTLLGTVVEARVKHKTTSKIKDGEQREYTNHQVSFRKVVSRPDLPVPAAGNVPSYASDEDIPFLWEGHKSERELRFYR